MDLIKEFNISTDEVIPNSDQVINALGYSIKNAPEPIIDQVPKTIETAYLSIHALGGFVIFDGNKVTVDDSFIKVGDVKFNCGKTIASQFTGSEIMCAVVATVGNDITCISNELITSGNMLEGYIVDVIGSLIAENSADYIEQKLSLNVSTDELSITNRLSPGYCGWDVSEQHKLFSMLPEDFCGVSLNESALMVPIKSVSAMVGIGKHIIKGLYPCSLCTMDKCYMRK